MDQVHCALPHCILASFSQSPTFEGSFFTAQSPAADFSPLPLTSGFPGHQTPVTNPRLSPLQIISNPKTLIYLASSYKLNLSRGLK